jgi:2-keto-3-deoxy-L-fuconate dehydrogenase
MAVNLGGTFLAPRCAMRNMGRPGSGGARGGSIVLTGSVLGLRATAPIDCGASKAAVASMAQIAGREGAPHGIRVNAVSPGGMDTPIGYAMDMVRQEAGGLAAVQRPWTQWPVSRSRSANSRRLRKSPGRSAFSYPIWQP